MHARSWRPSFRSLSLPGRLLLPLLVAAIVWSAASSAPPNPPQFEAQSSGGVFTAVTFHYFNQTPPTIDVRFKPNPVAAADPVTGFRVYLGSVKRTAGQPFSLGETPYDIGSQVDRVATIAGRDDADVNFSANSTQGLWVALTAYNQFGNESDYSTQGTIVPIGKPTNLAFTAPDPTTISLTFNHGTILVPGQNYQIITELFRKPSGTADSQYVFRKSMIGTSNSAGATDDTIPAGSNFTYGFRSYVNHAAGTGTLGIDPASPFTYSELATIVTNGILPENFTVTISGNSVGTNGGTTSPVVDLQDGDDVVIDQGTGQVVFNNTSNRPCAGTEYTTGVNGFPTSQITTFSLCYSADAACLPDPVSGNNHAGLFLPAQGGANRQLIGSGTVSFTYSGAAANLRLGVNDQSCTVNSGSFTAHVKRTRPIQ